MFSAEEVTPTAASSGLSSHVSVHNVELTHFKVVTALSSLSPTVVETRDD